MAEILTDDELSAIEERCNAATPGPWSHSGGSYYDGYKWFVDVQLPNLATVPDESNAAFIAHARQDVPRLIDEVRRLRAKVERLESFRHLNPPFEYQSLLEMCQDVVNGQFAEWGILDKDTFRGEPLRHVLNRCCEPMADDLALQLERRLEGTL